MHMAKKCGYRKFECQSTPVWGVPAKYLYKQVLNIFNSTWECVYLSHRYEAVLPIPALK